ncbi:MAG: hypothetical protein AAGB51_03080 [Planctomycetota bacterium]
MINTTLTIAAFVCASSSVHALPTGEQVHARYLEVTGGEDNHRRLKGLHIEGRVRIGAMELEGTYEQYTTAPAQYWSKTVFDQLGEVIVVVNGEDAWQTAPSLGSARLSGQELTDALLVADFYRDLDVTQDFDPIVNTGEADFEGERCYRVKLTSTTAAPDETRYYSVETGYLIARVSDNGSGPTEVYSDFREVGSVLMPHKTEVRTQGIAGLGFEFIRERIRANPRVPSGLFDPPAALN